MTDLAKNLAERIRDAVPNVVRSDANDKASVPGSSSFVEESSLILQNEYGIKMDDIAEIMEPKYDFFVSAGEQNVTASDFVFTLAKQFALTPISDKSSSMAKYFAGENNAKIAIAEFAATNSNWLFNDGYAISEKDGQAVVIAPSFIEAINGWEFVSMSAPFSMEEFIALPEAAKSTVPLRSGVRGDIGECADYALDNNLSNAPMAI